jgi:predicted membrane-bound mannosyltransferase
MSTLVDIRREWTYVHIMTPQRIATPADLGAVIRESRLAARLT